MFTARDALVQLLCIALGATAPRTSNWLREAGSLREAIRRIELRHRLLGLSLAGIYNKNELRCQGVRGV
jgi:hypothetical protein